MSTSDLQRLLAAADPVDGEGLGRLDFGAMEAELLADAEAEVATTDRGPALKRRHPTLILAGGVAVVALAVVLVLTLSGGGTGSPTRAYGAEVVRFAESTPLLLLEGPGWRVQHVNQQKTREGTEGSMEFVTGKPIPYETIEITGPAKHPSESGMFPPSVRQRRVELSWRDESLAGAVALQHEALHPDGERWVEMPVLDTTAQVDTRAEFFGGQGGPGNREMKAFWHEGGWTLTVQAAVPDQAAFEERLGWLTQVDAQTWLEAMPPAVVKAADFRGSVEEMVEGIPLPKTFAISRVPDEGLTTNRYQVGAQVAGTVACLWLRQWVTARSAGDVAAEQEAVQAMSTSRHWRILREMTSEGAYPQLLWEDAASMRKDNREGERKLPIAEGLSCAQMGIPLMAEKSKRQGGVGVPPPPD